jgi:hypothetical protein
MSMSGWVVTVAEAALLATSVVALIAAPVVFVVLLGQEPRPRPGSAPDLGVRMRVVTLQQSCRCAPGELDAARSSIANAPSR